MSTRKHKSRAAARDRPTEALTVRQDTSVRAAGSAGQQRGLVWLGQWEDESSLKCSGYTTLAQSPEISAGVNQIAALVAAMTIHKMKNTGSGNVRVYDEMARIVDVEPNALMDRSLFVRWIVRTLYLDGDGNAVVFPRFEGGRLRELLPVPAAYCSFYPTGLWGYRIAIGGRPYAPDELLHFAMNPGSFFPWLGEGIRVAVKDVAHNLKQALKTEQGFMESKWKPSVIVKVDAFNEKFKTPEGRRELLDEYITNTEAGEPWVVPADQIDVQAIKPLTLSDLALADFVELDKRTVASILGVPPFVLGVGEFKREEWNNFISTKIMPLAQIIEQQLTRKLLTAKDEFFRFNPRSLYNYDLKDMAAIADDQYIRGLMTGNEVRDWLGLSPMDGLDELVILENYIPATMIGEQKKLNGGDGT